MVIYMTNDFTVTIDYKNRDLEKIGERTYNFDQYAEMIKLELMRVIMDVEDSFYRILDSKPKEEWPKEVMSDFQKIRHKLLDQANAVERLPNTLQYKGIPCNTKNLSEVLAGILNG